MEDKEAIEILKQMLKKHPLNVKEQEAVRTAVGILGWSKLMEGYIDRKKRARDKCLRDTE